MIFLFRKAQDMGATRKYLFNAVLLSAVSVLTRFVSVSFNAHVAVKVGEECMGLFTLVASVFTLCVIIASAGVNLAVVRCVSEICRMENGFDAPALICCDTIESRSHRPRPEKSAESSARAGSADTDASPPSAAPPFKNSLLETVITAPGNQ